MKRSGIGPGAKSLDRGSTFASRGEGLKRSATAPSDFRDKDGNFVFPGPALSDRAAERKRERARRRAAAVAAARRAPRAEWDILTKTSPCAVCGSRMAVTGHHVLPLRMLKANSVSPDLWYDPRNHLPLCMEPSPERCHQRHENYISRVPRELVLEKAPGAIDFADEVGLLHLFDREYPEPRS